MLKERPILMSAPMVRALLAGTKTQTRRVVKGEITTISGMDYLNGQPLEGCSVTLAQCPYGRPGDRLWVRETWTWQGGMADGTRPVGEYAHLYVKYLADGEKRTITPNGFVKTPEAPPQLDGEIYSLRDAPEDFEYTGENTYMDRLSRWWQRKIPAIHMYRWASRITLEITEVRVQRLHGISKTEARAEGAPGYEEGIDPPPPDDEHEWSYLASFIRLWKSINGAESWDANPWVWALSFKVVSP